MEMDRQSSDQLASNVAGVDSFTPLSTDPKRLAEAMAREDLKDTTVEARQDTHQLNRGVHEGTELTVFLDNTEVSVEITTMKEEEKPMLESSSLTHCKSSEITKEEEESSQARKKLIPENGHPLRPSSGDHARDIDEGRDEAGLSSPRKASGGCSCGPNVGPFFRQLSMAVVCCLAALNTGMIHAYPAVALARWEEAGVNLTTTEITWFASTPMVVAVVVCVGSGVLVESLGVRRCLFFSLPFLAISWVMIAVAQGFWVLLLARVIQGIVASVFMVIITVYPVEVSAIRWRGIMVGVSEAMVMLGVFVTYLAGLGLLPSALAYTFAASLVPQLLCFYFMRESPLWLARQDRDDEAAVSLACLRGPNVDITWELEQIKANVYTERIQKPSASEQLLLLRKPVYLKPVLLCVLVLLFKELTGQYAAMAYTVKIFKMAGSTLDPYWCAVVMGAARFLPCFTSWLLIERVPRRVLLCSCMALASFTLATLGAFLWFWSRSEGGLPTSLGWVPLICLSIFTFSFGSGIGPTSWTLVAELMPSQVRNVGAGIINTCFSLFLFLVGLTFPYAVEEIGVGAVYIVYSVCSLVGVVFVVTCLPETKGITFDEIQVALDNKWQSSNVV